jgi:CheY-like chemotaxis protein
MEMVHGMGSLFSKTCLVVEDEDFMRRVLAIALGRLGALVIDCASGQEALTALNKPNRIDMVLSDILMPDMHGLHVLKQIRAGATRQPFDIPVALLTATNDEACVRYASDLSCDGFIVKPIGQASLSQRIEQMLHKRMALPYRPQHYQEVDAPPPEEAPHEYFVRTEAARAMPRPEPKITARETTPGVNDLLIGMVLAAPLGAGGRVIVPAGTPITCDLLVLLKNLDRVKSLGAVNAIVP